MPDRIAGPHPVFPRNLPVVILVSMYYSARAVSDGRPVNYLEPCENMRSHVEK